ALVPHAKRLGIGRSNFRLLSDIKSNESSLQFVYDVLRLTPFFKAFLVTTDVPEIYMQEFWATATVHHHSIRFKMDNKKHIVNLESFREMLHISLRRPHQPFVKPPFEEEILAFLWFLGHSGAIRRLTDVNINKCINRGDPLLPLSTSYHPPLPVKGSFYSKEKQDIKNSNAYKEYYAVATGVTPPKPKPSVRKTRSSSDTTVTPLTAAPAQDCPPRLKANSQLKLLKLRVYLPSLSGSGTDEGTGSIPRVFDVPTDESEEEISWNSTDEEGDDDEGKDGDDNDEFIKTIDENMQNILPKILQVKTSYAIVADLSEMELKKILIEKIEGNNDDEGNGEENLGTNVGRDEGENEEDEADELYREVNINLGRVELIRVITICDKYANLTPDARIESIFEMTSQMDVQTPTSVASIPMSAPTITSSTIATITTTQQAPLPPTTAPSTLLQDLSNFGLLFGFDHRLKTLEANFSKFMQTNQFARAVSAILGIVQRYMDQRMNEAVKVATSTSESATAEDPMQTTFEMEEPSHLEFETGDDDQPIVESSQHPGWFSQQKKPPTPDRDWNKTLPAAHESIQPLAELEFLLEEVYMATTDQLDWVNPECQQYPHNLLKPIPLIPNNRGHCVIPFDHFINNDLEYLRGGASSRKYTTFVTNTKAADYGHIKWIEDLVPRTMWIQEPIVYDNHSLWGISHWGRKRHQFYGFSVNQESARDVYSKRRIIAVTELKIIEWHNYKHLDWIMVRRGDDKLYKFKEGDFKRLRIQDIEDMLLLLVQRKLTNLTVEECFAFNVSVRMFTRSIVIQRHVEDLQLDVESYQKKLNLTKPDTYHSDLKRKEAYIAYSNPRGFIYQNNDK
nr:hypothetical protein [Tanacetum cinerariifolium]